MKIDLYGDEIGKVELVQHMGGDLVVVNSARASLGVHKEKIDQEDKKLIKYLINHRHTSTLEHCVITFRFKVPIYIARQHMRHRTWSYNEISRRYTSFNFEFYEPKEFRTQHKSNRQASNEDKLVNPLVSFKHREMGYSGLASDLIVSHSKLSLTLYEALLRGGICREQARGVLPQNMYTEYYGTVNLNNLFKFIDLRIHEGAQWEIQQVAKACLQIAETLFPLATKAYKSKKEKS